MKALVKWFGIIVILAMVFTALPVSHVYADTVVPVYVLDPSWDAVGGGGVFSAYIGPDAYDFVSPGSVGLFNGREAGIIKAGLNIDPTSGHYEDEGLFGFIPNVTIETLAAGPFSYDFSNQAGLLPVWVTIEIDTGVVNDRSDNKTYQYVPTTNPAGYHTVDATAGSWLLWADNNGTTTGSPMTLSQVAAANPGKNVVRAYLRLGMGDSYNNNGTGTIAWVDKVTIAGTTYDFQLIHDWYVSPAGSDSNLGIESAPFATLQHAISAAAANDRIHVAAGTYTEVGQIVIGKNLTIIGADKTTTVIKPAQNTGSSGDARGWFLVQSGVTFNLSNLTLDGTVFNVYQAIRHLGSGTIDNVIFSHINYPGYMGVAVAAMGGSGMKVDVTNSTFSNIGRIGVIFYGSGQDGTFDHNTYTGKGLGDWLDYAVEVGAGASATITNNSISNCLGVASDESTSAGVLVTTYYGLGTTANVAGNVFTGNTTGIAVGYDDKDTSVVIAHQNKFVGPTDGITSTAPTVDADRNWWGTSAASVIATKIDGPVTYAPYWVDEAMTILSSTAPATVYVDDDFTTSSCGGHYCGYDAFATIQEGINAVASGGTVNVAAGTYAEQVTIDKPVDLRGPNYGISAGVTPGTRIGEAVLTFPDPAVMDPSSEEIAVINVNSPNVSINGFVLNGAEVTDGVAIDAIEDNLTVKDNIIKNFPRMGVWITSYRNVSGSWINTFYFTGALIQDNLITNDTLFTDYYGIYVQGGTGTVSGNVINHVRNAIQIQPYAAPGSGLVTNNKFSAYKTPLYFNYTEAPTASWTFSDNDLYGLSWPTGAALGSGETVPTLNMIKIETFYTGNVTFTGNSINVGTANTDKIYMLRKVNVTGGTVDLEATLANNSWERIVVVRDGTTGLIKGDTFYSKIQDAIDAGTTVAGDIIEVGAGTYTENVIVNKSVEIAGAGKTNTIVIPAISGPLCSSGSICAGSSNVFLVQANNVKIHDLTVDGNNPDLNSGVVRGSVDVDARNGIVTNHTLGVFNNLEVYNTIVRNIYLRGIYASSGGTFNIHNNTITNTQGDDQSFAIMVYEGTGIVADNVVDFGSAVGANYSQGTQWLRNTLTNTPGGIHTDNAGSPSILGPEVLSGNTVDCTDVPGGYGVWTFVNRMPVTVENNTVTGCAVAYSAWGSGNANVATFTNNTASAPSPNSGSVGIYVTTNGAGWGYFDVNADFTGNNLSGFETGVYLSADDTKTITSTISRNNITGSTMMAAGQGTSGTYLTHLEENWWGSILGPQAPISDGLDVVQWCGTANPTCLPLMPQSGSTLTLSGTITDTGGFNIYVPGLTINLADGTTLNDPDSPCFDIHASYTTIEAESRLGAVCKPAAGKNGINVDGGLVNIVIKNLEFTGPGNDGIHFNGVLTDLMIVDNWIHNLAGNGITFTAQPAGVISIQGNLFQNNAGKGIEAGSFTVPAEFNSWGNVNGAAAGDGISAGVDADPYTHVDLYVKPASVVPVGGQITYTVYGDFKNVVGASFTLKYPTSSLTFGSTTNLSGFEAAGPQLFTVNTTDGTITFDGTVPFGSPALSGVDLPIFSVVFTQKAGEGVMDLMESTDIFTMFPTTVPAPSNNIYAAALVDGYNTAYGYTVTGSVTMQGRSVYNGVPATLIGPLYNFYAVSLNVISNNLVFTGVAGGTYTFTTNQPRYLNVTADLGKTVVVSANRSLPALELRGGNASFDNIIDIRDASVIGTNYLKTSFDPNADVNFDGVVDIRDLSIMGGNYLLTSATAYASWLP